MGIIPSIEETKWLTRFKKILINFFDFINVADLNTNTILIHQISKFLSIYKDKAGTSPCLL